MQRSSKTQRSAKKKPQRNNNYQHNKNKSTASAVLFLYDIDMDIFQAYNISNIIKGENEVKKHLISICIFLILIISLGIVFTSCGSSKVAKFGRYSGQNIARKLENEGFNVDVIDEDSLISICVDLGDYSVVTVPTDSMEPTFAKGDVIVAKTFKGDISSLKVGQVITFKSQIRIGNAYYESFNTHRIIQINSSGIIYTRGDNQNKKDGQDWKEYIDNHDGTITESVSVSDVVAVWGDVDGNDYFTSGEKIAKKGDIDWIVTVRSKYFANGKQVAIIKCASNKTAKGYYDYLKNIINSTDIKYGGKVVICGKEDYIKDIIDLKL